MARSWKEAAVKSPSKVLLCCALLESVFHNATQGSAEWARCFSCDGGIRSHTLELPPFTGVELQPTAWYQVCSTVPTGLLGRMLQFPTDGLVPVAPTCFSLIMIDVDQFKPKSTQRSVKSERLSSSAAVQKTSTALIRYATPDYSLPISERTILSQNDDANGSLLIPRQSRVPPLPPAWTQLCPPTPHDSALSRAVLDRGQFRPIVPA